MRFGLTESTTLMFALLNFASAGVMLVFALSGASSDFTTGILVFPLVEILIAFVALFALSILASHLPLNDVQAFPALAIFAVFLLMLLLGITIQLGITAAAVIVFLVGGSAMKFRRVLTDKSRKTDPLGRLIREFGFNLAFILPFAILPLLFLKSLQWMAFVVALWYFTSAILMLRNVFWSRSKVK